MNRAETADSTSEVEMEIVATRIPASVKDQLQDIADNEDSIGTVTISDVLRQAIDDIIDKHDLEDANE